VKELRALYKQYKKTVWLAGVFLIWEFPQWFQSVFLNESFFSWFGKSVWPHIRVTTDWLKIPVGVAIALVFVTEWFKGRPNKEANKLHVELATQSNGLHEVNIRIALKNETDAIIKDAVVELIKVAPLNEFITEWHLPRPLIPQVEGNDIRGRTVKIIECMSISFTNGSCLLEMAIQGKELFVTEINDDRILDDLIARDYSNDAGAEYRGMTFYLRISATDIAPFERKIHLLLYPYCTIGLPIHYKATLE
jgi:hypothetical protein